MYYNFYIFSLVIFFLGYLYTFLLNKSNTKLINLIKKYFIKKERDTNNSPTILYIFLSLIIIWQLFINLISNNYILFFYKYKNIIYKLGIAIFFFILGIMFSERKKNLQYFLNNYIEVCRCILLTGISLVLLIIDLNIISKLFIYIIHLIFTINYYKLFNKRKHTINNLLFITQYIWTSEILYLDSFYIIYIIFHL